MNNYQLLTLSDPIIRKFAQDRYIRNDLHKFKIIEYSEKIPNEFEFVIRLDLSCKNLKEIPLNILYCKNLYCQNNQLIQLPNLPYCKNLYCSYNKLTKLPNLPYCEYLYWDNNLLTTLPDLSNCKILDCYYNKLTNIPSITNIEEDYFRNNKIQNIEK